MSDKQGSGFFPTRKSRSVCFTRGGPTYDPVDAIWNDGETASSGRESEEDASND
jgi:hypothetical protein